MEWHNKFANQLRSMNFKPSKADPDLWMSEKDSHYEYITVFVDDLLIFLKNPQEIIDILINKFKYQLKGVGKPEYFNGADMHYDPGSNEWEMSAHTYIKSVCEKIEKVMDVTIKNYGSPMETGDYPEIDESDLLTQEDIAMYQMLIGCAQWAITLGRFDIQYATNTMARFGPFPRVGHVRRMLRLFGYLKYHPKHRIKFDSGEPNYKGLNFLEHDWDTYYPDCQEDVPDDAPTAYVHEMYMTVYIDASHGCDLLTRRSVTGILLCLNKTPIKWYSKR